MPCISDSLTWFDCPGCNSLAIGGNSVEEEVFRT